MNQLPLLQLTADEGMAAGSAGLLQQLRAARNGMRHDHGVLVPSRGDARRMGETINGMMAEYALCKTLNISWTAGAAGINTADACDNRLLIRSTDMLDGHLLITVQETMKFPNAAYALVVGSWPTFHFAGWCWVRDAVRDEYLRRRGSGSTIDAYWIPQTSEILQGFQSLSTVVNGWRKH